MSDSRALVSDERIERAILPIHGQKVMLDSDLADLYEVETRVLVQAVQRNKARFPEDFMFQLTKQEFDDLRSRSVISSSGWGGRRSSPYAFTEQGVAMLSSVLRSKRAVQVNIEIICGPSYGFAGCSPPTWSLHGSSTRWRRSTTRSSRWCSTPCGNSWRHPKRSVIPSGSGQRMDPECMRR